MSDSFADLWNSSVPSKPAAAPQKLGSVKPVSTQPKRPQQDVFTLLSSTGSSNTSSRSITPALSGTSSQRTTPNPATKPSSNGGDAFGDLLGGSLNIGGSTTSHMTMAERAAEAEKKKLEKLRGHQQTVKTSTSNAWAGLDSLEQPSSRTISSSSTSTVPTSSALEDDWGLDDLISKPTTKPTQNKPIPAVATDATDDWLGDFSSTSALAQPESHPQHSSLLSVSEQDLPPSISASERANSPGDFDFGDREDALLGGDSSNDEDDILGALAKPVDSLPTRKTPSKTQSSAHAESSSPSLDALRPTSNGKPSSRPVSPPPHILGQIVEMGFSIQQARVALASTDTGLDVQAALETLLSNGAASSTPRGDSPSTPDFQSPRSATRLMQNDVRRDASSSSLKPQPQTDQRDNNIQDQADKLLSQASELGMTMFTKASSFWKEGKERVQKAYAERAASTSGTSTPVAGRPKWMAEAIHDEDDSSKVPARYSDDTGSAGQKARRKPPQQQQQQGPSEPNSNPRTPDLFSDDLGAVAYVSPFRRGKKATSAAASQSTPATRSTPPPRVPVREPSPLRKRNLVSASASSIALANRHKDAGSVKFKLGQYADAESAYSLGIGALPSGHLSLVPLHNNRALARLKTGDYAGVIEDAGVVIEIVGAGYHPAREAKADKEEEGAGVELGDALVKALKRRAEALEGKEKWEEAGRDWGSITGLDWAGVKTRGDAARGVGRCRRMVTQKDAGHDADVLTRQPPLSKPKPRPPVKPASLSRAPPSQALQNLRAASNAAEAEDQERHELKDSVDTKLMAWKGGKETNIRALLGSLDNVLWPQLGLPKVGMAELVSPAQVKIKYTRTIAKLHPDKLNASNTTVEQRMIANGVFGALNEAWNAFKQ